MVIPKENWQEMFKDQSGFRVIPVETIEQLLEHALLQPSVADAVAWGTQHA